MGDGEGLSGDQAMGGIRQRRLLKSSRLLNSLFFDFAILLLKIKNLERGVVQSQLKSKGGGLGLVHSLRRSKGSARLTRAANYNQGLKWGPRLQATRLCIWGETDKSKMAVGGSLRS